MAQDAISRRYALLNQQLGRREAAQLQGEKEALSRRFASIGGLGSGASIKTEQIASQESARRLGEGRASLGVAELEERARQEEIEKQRAFQRSEREAGQTWQSGEAGKQRSFMTSERLGGQEFSAGEAGKQRGFLTSERLGGQEFQAGQNALARRLQEAGLTGLLDGSETLQARESRLGREMQSEQFGKQLEESKRQAMERESLGMSELAQQKDLADRSRRLQEKIANNEINFKNANLSWEKYVFNKEFPMNVNIANQNLQTAKDAAKSGGLKGLAGDVWSAVTQPTKEMAKWMKSQSGIKW